MIDVNEVLREVPHFETFCSVEKLHGLVGCVRSDPRFSVSVAGISGGGVPIHHVRFGGGSVKALVVGGPHAMEPIGGLTVYSLMTLLHQGHRALVDADVEWNIVPCLDPDGAILNEEWSQRPFTFESYMRGRFVQAVPDQVDSTFPITYKNLVRNQPSHEAKILQGILDGVRPDFYFSLHTCWAGGAFYLLSRDIDKKYYRELYSLLKEQGLPIQRRPLFKEVCAQFSEGIVEMLSVERLYDYLAQTTRAPEESRLVRYGGGSWDYLARMKPGALAVVVEMGHAWHPSEESDEDTGQNLRQFLLRLGADNKYIASVLLQEWQNVKDDLDHTSPFYKALAGGLGFPLNKEEISEGGFPLSWYTTRDVVSDPNYDRPMTEGDRFNACMVESGFLLPLYSYQFVRLLKVSKQSSRVRQALERLDRIFDAALSDIQQYVDFRNFRSYDCDTLAKVQLGSGLIVLNSLLEAAP